MTVKPSSMKPVPKAKTAVTIVIVVALIGTGILFSTAGLTGMVAQPGLFGTNATMFSDLNLIAQFVFLVGLSIGYVLARKGDITAHQYLQTGMVLFNIVTTIFVMIVGYIDYVIPGMPENLSQAYGIVTTIHAVFGLLAIFCGIYLLLHMNRILPKRYRIKWWRKLMRLTFALYWFVGILGLGVYYVWFLI